MPTRQPVAVSSLLEAPGSLPVLLQRARELNKLNQALKNALPDPLRDHCEVLNLRGQTLTLAASSPAWATRLRYLTPTVLQQLAQSQSVKVRTIQVRVVPTRTEQRRKPAPRHARLSRANARLLLQTAESLQDERLRSALKRIASHWKKAEGE